MTEIKSAALELGTERIRKLLVQYAVPAIIAMTASSLYNMVDSIFIGHGVGPLAISGLALTFPLMNLAACFIVILINKGLKEYGGDLMIGAYGIVNRLAFFFVMIVLGVNQGMQPIAGYNFGAKQYDRVMRVLKLTMIGATCVTTAGFLLGEFMPRLAVGMFTSDEELIRLAVEGMRIVFFCFPIIGFQMVATNFFMSIGMAGKAIFLSLSRQLLFLMPGLIFLPHIFDVCTEWNGSWGVWCSMPLSDFLASLVAFFMLTYQLRKFRAIGAENAAKEG